MNITINVAVDSIEEAQEVLSRLNNKTVAMKPVTSGNPLDLSPARVRSIERLKVLGLDRAPRATQKEMNLRTKIDEEREKINLTPILWQYDLVAREYAMKEQGLDIYNKDENSIQSSSSTGHPLAVTASNVKIDLDEIPE